MESARKVRRCSYRRNIFGTTSFSARSRPSWNTAKVTNMDYMFYNAAAFNADITSWNTAAVTNMGYMFQGATALKSKYTRSPSSPTDDGPPSAWS